MILVTGGAGFVGSNLVAALDARADRDIAICDRLGRGDKWRNVAKRRLADIVPPEHLLGWLERPGLRIDMVLHMGAISATTETDADLIVAANVRLPLELWGWCARRQVPFIYASSAAVYGGGEAGFDDAADDAYLAGLRPLNPYGWSKLLFDRRVLALALRGGPAPPQWAGLRFFNVYGPNEYHKEGMRSVAAVLYPSLAAGEPARLFRSYRADVADGEQRRDFVHVDDCVQVMLWLMDHPEVSGLFNVGTGRARTWNDLARALFAALGREPRIEYIDMPESLRPRYQYHTEARMERLHAAGYPLPFTTLEAGIDRYVRDFLAAADPYR